MAHVIKFHLSVINCVQPWKNLPPFSYVSAYSAPFHAGYSIQHDNVAQHNKGILNMHTHTSCKVTFIDPNVYEITQDL